MLDQAPVLLPDGQRRSWLEITCKECGVHMLNHGLVKVPEYCNVCTVMFLAVYNQPNLRNAYQKEHAYWEAEKAAKRRMLEGGPGWA